MDPASLALGVIPLIASVVKSYRVIYAKLMMFRHYSSHVQRIQKKFKVQRRIFENECHLLFRFALDDSTIAAMKLDPSHPNWSDQDLDDKFRSHFDQNYESLLEIVREVREAAEDMERELGYFAVLEEQQKKGESLKDTIRRVKDGVQVVFRKSRYDNLLKNLRDSNDDLKWLREQIAELQKPRTCVQAMPKSQYPNDWTGVYKIRRASKALHRALIEAWSCGQASHLKHFIILFIETGRMGNEVQLNLAIMCPVDVARPLRASLLQLQVRSRTILLPSPRLFSSTLELPGRQHRKMVRFMTGPKPVAEPVSCAKRVMESEDRPFYEQEPRANGALYGKRVCVDLSLPREIETRPSATTSESGSQSEVSRYGVSCDLRRSKDICSHLARATPSSLYQECLGHIDIQSDESFRHSFYPLTEASQRFVHQGELVPADQILDHSVNDLFDIVKRLKLAQSIASAVLKFHSTPWMGELWRLGDLSFFQRGEDSGISDSLRTLHVGVELAQDNLREIQSSTSTEGIQLTPSNSDMSQHSVSEDDRLFCGINNMSLHSLGVVLLQIDRWTRVEPGDVLEVRKMARRRGGSSLGPRYQNITQKCLACDFGYGDDLERPQLQRAVYENIIGELGEMIASLDLGRDIE